MLLSDRDILAAQAEGHISLDPWTRKWCSPLPLTCVWTVSSVCSTIMRTRMSIRLRIRRADRAVRGGSGRTVDSASG